MKTIAEELRSVALLIDTLEDTYVSPHIFPEWVRRLRDIATRCEGMVSLAQAETAVRDAFDTDRDGEVPLVLFDEEIEEVVKAVVNRLKGGD